MLKLDEALAHAKLAADRFPLLPRVWLDLSQVFLARLEINGAVEALEQALQINPSWAFASRALSESYERLNELGKSRETLERAIARSPLDSDNHGYYAALLWKLGEKERALDTVEHALRLNPGYEWAWHRLREWSRNCGTPDRAVKFATALTETRGGEARSWLMLAKVFEGPEDADKSLAALEKAISLNPRSENMHDLKAFKLTELGKYEEARGACDPSAWNGSPPVMLRGRALWVLFSEGEKSRAFKEMKLLLKGNPDYYWGWRWFADWALELKERKTELEAGQHLVRLAPRDAISYGYLGDAYLRDDEPAKAKVELARAFKLDPNYSWSGFRLFDLQLKDKQLFEAAATLNVLRKHGQEWGAREGEIKLEVKRGDRSKAVELLRVLCTAPPDQTWALTNAAGVFANAGWDKDAQLAFEAVLENPSINPKVGSLWITARMNRGKNWMPRRFKRLLSAGTLGKEAATTYLNALGNKKFPTPLNSFAKKYRNWLQGDTSLWGDCCYALTNCGQYRKTVQWTRDWRQREGVQAWMLQNVATALRHLGNDRVAFEVSLKAIDLPNDQTTVKHRLWVALDQAIAGQIEEAEAGMAKISTEGFGDYQLILHRFLKALITVHQAADRKREFREQRRILKEQCHPKIGTNSPELRRYYRKTVKRMATDAGGWAGIDGLFYRLFTPVKPNFRIIWILIVLISAVSRSCGHH
jgi:tetratricopeptide (TPR) repeat protein